MISSIRLQQFRSYRDASFEFGSGVNIIVGPNAAGKTNLLEALLVVARGGSYRGKDSELVQLRKVWYRLDAGMQRPEGHRTIKLQTDTQPLKTYELDGKTYQRLSLPNTIPVVLFEPNHLGLLNGSPEERRNYLDGLLEQTISVHNGQMRSYRRLLAQRNALLKRASRPSSEELFPWNLRLAELGAVIARRRTELVATIDKDLGKLYGGLSGTKTNLRIQYQPNFPPETYESAMLHKLETHAALDAERGFTAYGPHREDFTVLFNGRVAAEVASRGETRTAVLALKVIELQQLENARGQKPLLLLDDVFSELDGKRRHALTNFLQNYQTFITTTDADVVVKHFTEAAKIIPLS